MQKRVEDFEVFSLERVQHVVTELKKIVNKVWSLVKGRCW